MDGDSRVAEGPVEVLQRWFGHKAFRGRQEEVVRHVVAGGDAVVLFPTGAGKSMCYQVPALCREGTGIVVSPLIALMRDQVEALKQAGVAAAALNSTLSAADAYEVRRDYLSGKLKLLYVTPERLVSEPFLDFLTRGHIALIAIDEAHCVSQWGHDFRPEYMQLSLLADRFPGVPRMALTATADPQTREDLRRRLRLEDAPVFATSFDRPNIRYAIVPKQNPRRQLLDFLSRHEGDSGIIYCLSRKKVEDIAEYLNAHGVRALPYHAGMDRAVRDANQDAFLREEGLALVATIAFGMGVDSPSVRYVAHLDLPGSVEAYYQETGRAGRDGLPSDAWMTYGMADVVQRGRMIDEGEAPAEVKRVERAKLSALLGICETAGCRRQAILAHFGESHPGGCGACDTCLEPVETWDGTEAAQKALSAIYRTGERYGAGYVIEVLRGVESEKIVRNGHHQIKTFGVGSDLDEKVWQSVIRQLAAHGAIVVDHDAYGALTLGETARAILKGERRVQMRKDRVFKAERISQKATRAAAAATLDDDAQRVFEALRAERMRIAREQGVPPYVVFHDATLRDMAMLRPRNRTELAAVQGVGEAKLDRYGAAFLDAVRRAVG
ncbi:DNA helicase RecQ [Alsobacter soli]|uniref:DNA helicase RecQ n=1 Tax=Alsobacter soli TaxID=2109933 RepID=A0A2T1HPP3_9HYPH|nr:DNA helicase RecQ [Alsobacter soli]PSC03632.1 DNA helicase RecQ [Alsobacter soli]